MSCFSTKSNKKSKQSTNRDVSLEYNTPSPVSVENSAILNEQQQQYQQPDVMQLPQPHHILVNSYNVFNYKTMQWTNIIENTYWDGVGYYNVYTTV